MKHYNIMFLFQGKYFTEIPHFLMLISLGSFLFATGTCFECSLEPGSSRVTQLEWPK